MTLLEKLQSHEEQLWYAQQASENGWSRDVLVLQIETGLYQHNRQGTLGALHQCKE
ncbi:hypothetical protein LEP3755_65550 (plasmid) [Leptolyngbya sp. NIES-3755]|nr:hypothetical protein LEP3755_65550 [Leptolyngbya sp. NIES-3755]